MAASYLSITVNSNHIFICSDLAAILSANLLPAAVTNVQIVTIVTLLLLKAYSNTIVIILSNDIIADPLRDTI